MLQSRRSLLLTIASGDTFDPVSHLHVIVVKRHEDASRGVFRTRRVDLRVGVLPVKALVPILLNYTTVHLENNE